MRNIKLTLSYDGTDFHGWQRQNGLRTVQEVLEDAIFQLTGSRSAATASGRTDAGVHALGQVVHFLSASRHSTTTFVKALNALLPPDVRILAAEERPQAFHATLDAKSKRYRYVIDNGAFANVFQLRYSWHVRHELDDDAMARAGRLLLGRHDFHSFETSWPNRTSSVRTIFDLTVERAASVVTIEVEADGFLYNMVRSIAGTLVLVGSGKRREEWIEGSTCGREPRDCGPDRASQGSISDQGLLWTIIREDSLATFYRVTWDAGAPLPRLRDDAEMRIVHVITRLIIGGAQENTLLTVEGLDHHYHDDVTLITGPAEGPEGDLFDRATQLGLKVLVFPELVRPIRPDTDFSAYRRLRAAFRKLEPEVVHTHSSKAGIVGRAAAWHEKMPAVIHTIHGMPFGKFESPLKNRLYISLERWAARRCHAIVSVCNAMTEQALAAGVGRPEQFVTIYSGMNAEAFLDPPRPRSDVRRELGLADDEVAFATVARLFELKGHVDIVAVANRVLVANPKVRFVWIGDGILRERLIADLDRRGIQDSFILTGLVPPDRIPELLNAVDAVIHPSLREGLARVIPQALLVGRPVISYDVDGAREVVLPETGILLKPRDLDGLCQAILTLAASPRMRAEMGRVGRVRFADQFRHETMTRQIRSLYERILELQSHPAPVRA